MLKDGKIIRFAYEMVAGDTDTGNERIDFIFDFIG